MLFSLINIPVNNVFPIVGALIVTLLKFFRERLFIFSFMWYTLFIKLKTLVFLINTLFRIYFVSTISYTKLGVFSISLFKFGFFVFFYFYIFFPSFNTFHYLRKNCCFYIFLIITFTIKCIFYFSIPNLQKIKYYDIINIMKQHCFKIKLGGRG